MTVVVTLQNQKKDYEKWSSSGNKSKVYFKRVCVSLVVCIFLALLKKELFFFLQNVNFNLFFVFSFCYHLSSICSYFKNENKINNNAALKKIFCNFFLNFYIRRRNKYLLLIANNNRRKQIYFLYNFVHKKFPFYLFFLVFH